MKLFIKKFDELSLNELYDILKLRIDVFVVEQKCPYPEADDRDQKALHIFLKDGNTIQAYLRVLDRGVESEYVSIGRVVTATRNKGLGIRILNEGIRAAQEVYRADKIYLEAQTYAIPFYEKAGFRVISEKFVMDGIPHVKMLLNIGRE